MHRLLIESVAIRAYDRRDDPRGAQAFTLVELLVVTTIVAIALGIGVPALVDLRARGRVADAVAELAAVIELARAEAVARGTTVVVCRSTEVDAHAPTCDEREAHGFAGDDWAVGWLVLARSPSAASPDVVVRRGRPARDARGARVVLLANLRAARYAFGPDGLRDGGALGFSVHADHRAADARPTGHARCLRVNSVGRTHVESAEGARC